MRVCSEPSRRKYEGGGSHPFKAAHTPRTSEGHQHAVAQSGKELQNRSRPGLQDRFHHELAGRILNRDRDRCLVNIQPVILFAVHEGAPFVGCCATLSQPTPKGRPFIMR